MSTFFRLFSFGLLDWQLSRKGAKLKSMLFAAVILLRHFNSSAFEFGALLHYGVNRFSQVISTSWGLWLWLSIYLSKTFRKYEEDSFILSGILLLKFMPNKMWAYLAQAILNDGVYLHMHRSLWLCHFWNRISARFFPRSIRDICN